MAENQTDGAPGTFQRGYRTNPPYLGSSQLGLDYARDEDEADLLIRDMLSRELNTRRLVAFIGAGVSSNYGYKSWKKFAKKIVRKTISTLGNDTRHLTDTRRRLLAEYLGDGEQTTESPFEIHGVDRTLLVLSECREALEGAGKKRVLPKLVKKHFKKDETGPLDGDPLGDLMTKLEIRRFVTTNYDVEIERAFVRALGSPRRPLNLPSRPASRRDSSGRTTAVGPVARSISVDPTKSEQLVEFAIGAPGFSRGVFHCHGIATAPKKAIVTERDYQRIYLRPDPLHVAYREALELVFSANPVLFVGLGMQEPDILRPLRQFVSERRRTANERPLFALMGVPSAGDRRPEIRRFLYLRYGVKTLFYEPGTDRHEHRRNFLAEIDRIALHRTEWWEQWQLKPPLRVPAFQRFDGENLMAHHKEKPIDPEFGNRDDEDRLRSCFGDDEVPMSTRDGEGQSNSSGGLRVLFGPPGSGKGSLGLRLAEGRISGLDHGFDKCFFATTHFSNDFLSVLDAAADYFSSPTSNPDERPIERLLRALYDPRSLLVIGGVERLLIRRSLDPPERPPVALPERSEPTVVPAPNLRPGDSVGRPITIAIRDLFRRLDGVAGNVVLTTSVWPDGLELDDSRVARLAGVSKSDVVNSFEAVVGKSAANVIRLYDALNGHAFALTVALAATREIEGDSSKARWLKDLATRVTSIEATRRPERVIEAALHEMRLHEHDEQVVNPLAVLQRVALITTPVHADAVSAMFGDDRGAVEVETVQEHLELLAKRHLLLRITSSRDQSDDRHRYTAHTLIRSHVLHSMGSHPQTPGEPTRFLLAGYSAEAEETVPVSVGAHRLSTESADALLDHLEREVAKQDPDPGRRRSLARAAFGLIRSRWSALGLSELAGLEREGDDHLRSHYDSYQLRLIRLLNAVRQASPGKAWLTAKDAADQLRREEGILYADEMSWLYNELGLVAFCKGMVHDSVALWEQCREINLVAERGNRYRRWLESELNLTTVGLERGNLRGAASRLDEILRRAHASGDLVREGRALGYIGFVNHLGADAESALAYYTQAIDILQRERIHRGTSHFRRLRGDLQRLLGEYREAESDLRHSVASAELGKNLDLANAARLSQAALAMKMKKAHPAAPIERVLEFARRMGIPKLEADACKVLSETSLGSGDLDQAGRLARRAIAIASRHGLRLREISTLVLLGRIARQRGNVEGARTIFESAVRAGRAQSYQLQVDKAESELREMALPVLET